MLFMAYNYQDTYMNLDEIKYFQNFIDIYKKWLNGNLEDDEFCNIIEEAIDKLYDGLNREE